MNATFIDVMDPDRYNLFPVINMVTTNVVQGWAISRESDVRLGLATQAYFSATAFDYFTITGKELVEQGVVGLVFGASYQHVFNIYVATTEE